MAPLETNEDSGFLGVIGEIKRILKPLLQVCELVAFDGMQAPGSF
jgi:hypothetical protein